MRIVAVIAALCAAAFLAVAAWHRRNKDPRLPSQGAVAGAILILLASCMVALARPSPYPPVTQFIGDRYGSAQLGAEVTRAIDCPPPACIRKGRAQKRAPVSRQRLRHVPIPAARPVTSDAYRVEAPLSLGEGVQREAVRAVGRPAAWCGWWLGQHLGIQNRKLWLARNWAHVGSPASPGPGVVVVWAHHVGIITGHGPKGWIIKSGNDGGQVRERSRSVAGAIAFRRLS